MKLLLDQGLPRSAAHHGREYKRIAAVIQYGLISNCGSTGAGSEVMARTIYLQLPLTLFASIRGSDLISIDASKVIDVPICSQFAFTE